MQVTRHGSIGEIDSKDWNRLLDDDAPFLRHEFLNLAEELGCVSASQGWQPCHITLSDNGKVLGALPLYEKTHSWGEFVFDWAWADAYSRAGLKYYPKLVCAAPFTPATSQRILLRDPNDRETARSLLSAARELVREKEFSSLHIQFPTTAESNWLREDDFLIRTDCQFHWFNNAYSDFDAFLATFTAAKRKKARRDRRRVVEQNIQFRHLAGGELIGDIWSDIYALISRTFLIRGHIPYFTEQFFREICAVLPEALLVVVAEIENKPIAAAVFFVGTETLYGRYWGSDGQYDALHFETCYFQGIEFCINNKLQTFQPGTQGEHKVARGFTPVSTHSAHWLLHAEFSDAIDEYLQQENRHVSRYMDAVESHTPYKKRDVRK